jgi:hypothetical protein
MRWHHRVAAAHEEGLLYLGVVQKPELGLHHPKLVVDLKRLSYLGE